MRELVDPDPVAVHREVSCEMFRILDAFGSTEGQLRVLTADDSIYRTPTARARFDSVEAKLAGKGFAGTGPLCDSLKAIANREAPIAPVDSAIRNPTISLDSIVRRP
jgi:hypothetical protein